jgi:hypothetical protein
MDNRPLLVERFEAKNLRVLGVESEPSDRLFVLQVIGG